MFIDDATLQKEKIYISYGLFEDVFLNNFATGIIRKKQKTLKLHQNLNNFLEMILIINLIREEFMSDMMNTLLTFKLHH